MREGWTTGPIGDRLELELDQVNVQPGRGYPIVGVLNRGRGLLTREAVTSETTSYPRLTRVSADRLIYSKLKAFEGAITVASESMGEAYASSEFPTFKCGDSLLPPYARLLTQRPQLWDELALLSKGIGGRRERLHPRDFLQVRVSLPPVAEQKRIVDVIGSVDDAIDAALQLHQKASAAQAAFVGNMEGDLMPLVKLLLRIDAGRSPIGVERAPKPGERAVLKVSAIGPDGFRPHEAKVVPHGTELDPRMSVSAHDVLMVRANGVLSRVGAVCKVEGDYPQLYLCDKPLRLVPDPSALVADWLFAALTSTAVRNQIEARATGSDMRNISQAAIKEITIPVPALVEQENFGAMLATWASVGAAAATNANRLRILRSELLVALLSGEHAIPESYDEFLGA